MIIDEVISHLPQISFTMCVWDYGTMTFLDDHLKEQ